MDDNRIGIIKEYDNKFIAWHKDSEWSAHGDTPEEAKDNLKLVYANRELLDR